MLPIVQANGVAGGALEECAAAVFKLHRDQRLRIPGIFAPGRVPSLRVKRITFGASQVGEEIKLMHRSFDHQGMSNLVPEYAPTAALPQVGGEMTDQVVQCPVAPRAQFFAQAGLILVEAVAHRHAHLHVRPFDFVGDAR